MTRNHTALRDAGEALFGANWQSDMARALAVPLRTMQRWAAGANPMPAEIWPRIAELAKQRGAELLRLSEAIERV